MMVAKRHFDAIDAEPKCLRDFASSFDSADSSGDLTILCNGTAIKCHKYVNENASSIDLQDETDYAAVHAMLEFCYSVNYKRPAPNTSLFHVRMYSLAERFIIPDLEKLATDRFREVAEIESNEELAAAIREAYAINTDSDKMLKQTIIEIVLQNARMQLPTRALNELMDEIPAYAADLARGALKNLSPLKRKYRCPGGCARVFEQAFMPSEDYTHHCGIHRSVNDWTMSGEQWNSNWGKAWVTD
ncbi:hypothetical protein HII31_12485 [Pseudocercospora fuligena]|uniref:BTB domain-containing protein n=1 Tax=Pseudocercospora fuligena TaxID=685502 RepID=A0A8H6VBI5_9PEZI|nr:hypothetical protein HII31_12485 [Pseudocercospora fuligena]